MQGRQQGAILWTSHLAILLGLVWEHATQGRDYRGPLLHGWRKGHSDASRAWADREALISLSRAGRCGNQMPTGWRELDIGKKMASEERRMVVVKPISLISHSRLRPSDAQGRRWQHSAGHSISWGLKPQLDAGVKMKCAMDLAVPPGGVPQGSVWAQSCLMC